MCLNYLFLYGNGFQIINEYTNVILMYLKYPCFEMEGYDMSTKSHD